MITGLFLIISIFAATPLQGRPSLVPQVKSGAVQCEFPSQLRKPGAGCKISLQIVVFLSHTPKSWEGDYKS
ncbi:hypothetical protein CLIB1444_01S02190 [[Candida] jaroonii]|uniref:Uncharacterized protein n=1 Tax=[Candida] jaroonii TaxID=467808 RepID=A0ACA9Y0B4_9ASCO|nr:hypothetical protein CLIB1444_01S02190 [[Candida] jaroonii]